MALSMPHDIVSGTLADATQVQENFEHTETRALDKTGDTATGTINTRTLLPSADATYDLGSGSFRYRNLYLSGSITGPGAPNTFGTISVSGQSDVVADSSADTLTLAAGTGITITTVAGTDTITIAQSATATTTAGSSGVAYKAMGLLYGGNTSVGNVGAGEDTLLSRTIAANVLTTDGDGINFNLIGHFTTNSNAKRIKIKFGATTFFDIGTGFVVSSATSWVAFGSIIRTSGTTQRTSCTFHYDQGGQTDMNVTTAGETLSGAVAFTVTGEATSTDDIVLDAYQLLYVPTSSN